MSVEEDNRYRVVGKYRGRVESDWDMDAFWNVVTAVGIVRGLTRLPL